MKIAVFRALHLGDLLCAIPSWYCLKRKFPEAEIYLIGLPSAKELVNRYTFLSGLIPFPGYPGMPEQEEPSFTEIEEFVQEMCAQNFDLLLQMHGDGSFINPLLQRIKVGKLLAFCPDELSKETDMIVYPDGIHEVERHLKLICTLVHEVVEKDREMFFPLYMEDWHLFEQLRKKNQLSQYAIIHVGGRSEARHWPLVNFVTLAQRLAESGYQIVLTGIAAEKSRVDEMELMMHTKVINLLGKTSLGVLGCLVKEAEMLICNCTGISHLAAALKTKSIVISMDGEAERWGPQNNKLHHTYDGRGALDLISIKMRMDRLLASSD